MLMLELYTYQQLLDDFIFMQRGIIKKPIELLPEKFLALEAEVGEFLEAEKREDQLEEYIDSLHFILSIHNALDLESHGFVHFGDLYDKYMGEVSKYITRNEVILNLFISIADFAQATRCFSYWSDKRCAERLVLQEKYKNLIQAFMIVGAAHGFTAEEIVVEYKRKRLENFHRANESK